MHVNSLILLAFLCLSLATPSESKGRTPLSPKEAAQAMLQQPKFLINLNELALEKSNNHIIGREPEIAQVINALKQPSHEGTVLVGDSDIDKIFIVEALAYMLANDTMPELEGREIFVLDAGSMWESVGNVQQLLERFNNALKFIAADPGKRILFIDDIHQLLGTSSSPPITDIMKPYLESGDLQLIGATTHEGYEGSQNRAALDRLSRIDIDPPSVE